MTVFHNIRLYFFAVKNSCRIFAFDSFYSRKTVNVVFPNIFNWDIQLVHSSRCRGTTVTAASPHTVCVFAPPRSWEKEALVASTLSKMDGMQARLRQNLEAIGMLNQQVSNPLPPARANTHTLLRADTGPRCSPPAVELAQKETEELSCVLLQKRALAHPFPLPAIEADAWMGGGGLTNGVRRRR